MSYKCIPDNLQKATVGDLKKCVEEKRLLKKVVATGKRGPVKQDYINVLV